MWSHSVYKALSVFIYRNFLLLILDGLLISLISTSVSNGLALGEEDNRQVCGLVGTYKNDLVSLIEGATLSKEEIQQLRTQKPRDFLPDTENGCVINICGYTKTKRIINDSMTGIPTLNYVGCQIIQTGDEDEISSNIYNEVYNATAVSCGCKIQSSLCNVSCDTKIKSNLIPWRLNECAILYEETNCGHCWFPPHYLKSGENYTSDNAHHMVGAIIRENCFLFQNYSVNGHAYTAYFHASSPVAIFEKEAFKSESGVMIFCTCTKATGSSISTSAHTIVDPSTTNSLITFITTPFTPVTASSTTVNSSTTTSSEDAPISLSAVIWAVVGGSLVVLSVTTLILTRRYWSTGRCKPTLGNTVSSDMFFDSNTDKDEYVEFPGTFLTEANSPPVSQMGVQSCQYPTPALYSNSSLSTVSDSVAGLIFPQDTSEVPTNRTIPTQEDQLTAKIVNEVKKLMEGFLVSLGHDEALPLSLEQSYSLVASTRSDSEADSKLSQLSAQFHQLCSPAHILPRNAFCISKRDLEKPLGVGQFAIVYLGSMKLEPDGLAEKVAVKKIKWPCSNDGIVESFLREVKTFETIGTGNEYTVTFLGASCYKDGLFIVTRFCEGGSLRSYLVDNLRPRIFPTSPKNIRERTTSIGDGYVMTLGEQVDIATQNGPLLTAANLRQFLVWCEEIACAMEYLSLRGIIHVDLAARNILLTRDLHVKICDFGLSRKCLNRKDYCSQSLLTDCFPYNSFVPEWNTENVREPKQASLYVDIWAYGCTLWELFTVGEQLYPDVKDNEPLRFMAIAQLLKEGRRLPKPPLAPNYVWKKLNECWNEVPRSRPNFTHLHHYFHLKRMEVEGC